MIKLFLTLIFASTCILSFSQIENKKNQTIENQQLQKDADWKDAIEKIEQLKNGALLVALDYQQKKIAYYEKFNNNKAAEKLRVKQQQINAYIIHAIDSLYSFSKVYYVDFESLTKIQDNNFDEVVFYNSEGKQDASIKFNGGFFLVGFFGHVEEPKDALLEGEVQYGTKNSMSAFVLHDATLKQLKRPFPYYSKYFEKGNVKKRYNLPIRHLQEYLEDFASKGNVKYSKREKRRAEKRERRAKKRQAKNQ